MHRVFIVSNFEKYEGDYNCFHFNGFFKGKKIKQIRVKGGSFIPREAYMLAIEKVCVDKSTLYGELVKYKQLFI